MGNHFHLLVKMLPETDFHDGEIKQKFERYYGEKRLIAKGQIPSYRSRW